MTSLLMLFDTLLECLRTAAIINSSVIMRKQTSCVDFALRQSAPFASLFHALQDVILDISPTIIDSVVVTFARQKV